VHARGHGAAAAGYEARAAIITVPLAVLRTLDSATPALRFAPALPQPTRRAIDGMATGSVVRVTLVLRDRLWEDPDLPGLPRGSRLDRLSYLHVSGGRFNVWWTLFPVIERVIVGWSGGPPARALAALGRSAIEDIAIDELALRALRVPRARLEASLETCLMHDWEQDPFSRGAYSYATVGGAGAAAALARPVEDTLFFAGEAADAEGRTGTVEGAIGSGRRAAHRVLAVLADAR
jgi:monoamine oxidase